MKNLLKRIYYNIKILRARYKRTGSCKACGNCCKNIKLLFDGELIKTQELFEEGKKYNPAFKMLYINGRHENGALRFSCIHLGKNNKCKTYLIRPLTCWLYPFKQRERIPNSRKTREGCGFSYKPSISFTEVMDHCSSTFP